MHTRRILCRVSSLVSLHRLLFVTHWLFKQTRIKTFCHVSLIRSDKLFKHKDDGKIDDDNDDDGDEVVPKLEAGQTTGWSSCKGRQRDDAKRPLVPNTAYLFFSALSIERETKILFSYNRASEKCWKLCVRPSSCLTFLILD